MNQEGTGKRVQPTHEVTFGNVPMGAKFHRLTPIRVFCLKLVTGRFGCDLSPPSPYNAVSLQSLDKTALCGELFSIPDDEIVKYEPV